MLKLFYDRLSGDVHFSIREFHNCTNLLSSYKMNTVRGFPLYVYVIATVKSSYGPRSIENLYFWLLNFIYNQLYVCVQGRNLNFYSYFCLKVDGYPLQKTHIILKLKTSCNFRMIGVNCSDERITSDNRFPLGLIQVY